MSTSRSLLAALLLCLALPRAAAAQAAAPADAALFRIYLTDGTSLVSYGELARVADQVIFSLPVGGSPEEPRLHPVTLADSLVDWSRTERYATSVRYQRHSARAEQDYEQLTEQVADVLNRISRTTDRGQALALALEARSALAEWPRAHFGYRQDDLREVVALLDASIARLQGIVPSAFELSLVAAVDPVALEPLVGMPSPAEQLDQVVRLIAMMTSARDRVLLLRSALALVNEGRVAIDPDAVAGLRRRLEAQLRQETEVDARYARLTQEIAKQAARAAADAKIGDVQRVLNRIPREDERLGRQRPETVQALTSAVQAQLERARHLRLLRDQWAVRQQIFRQYQRMVGSELVQLVKAQSSLEQIRALEGPDPKRLASLQSRLSGGAARLQRIEVPDYLRATHDLVIGAWRFAENAARTRYEAISSGKVSVAWEASSAAAGALMMLSRAQQEIRALLEPPKLQ